MNIALVCDFFYPQRGGVEFHIHHLAQQLANRGHNVCVVTHAYGDRKGIRTLSNGVKVYHIPFLVFYRQTTFPTVFSCFPSLRTIFIREQIDLVHGHASLSSLALEACFHAKTMGIKTVLTDHSLHGFADYNATGAQKTFKFAAHSIDRLICVSNTAKENMVLRAARHIIEPAMVSVIPNAVVSEDFYPASDSRQHDGPRTGPITIVVISRLYTNKGIDLLTAMIPRICHESDNVRFLVAGNGPKYIDIQQTIETFRLHDRVELIPGVRHEEVRDVMVQGQIYLHPSLTEAFGTVLVEAASCGLLVVTTRVGGIPEVLPSDMTIFAQPSVDSLVQNTLKAINIIRAGKLNTSKFHERVKNMYHWSNVAERTEQVYNSIEHDTQTRLEKCMELNNAGSWSGKLFLLMYLVDVFLYFLMELLYPNFKIDRAVKWPRKTRSKREDKASSND